jgi:hypothetical protein
MDSFAYMSMVSRIAHYEEIARRMAKEARIERKKSPAPVKLAVAPRPGQLVDLPETQSA